MVAGSAGAQVRYPIRFTCETTDGTKSMCALLKARLLLDRFRVVADGGLGGVYLKGVPFEEQPGDAKKGVMPSYRFSGVYRGYEVGVIALDFSCVDRNDYDCAEGLAAKLADNVFAH